MQENPTRILVVDDHNLFRKGLIALLTDAVETTVVGEAGTGAEAIAQAESLSPDVILMDIQMPVMDGLTATKMIRESNSPNSNIPIIAVTADAMSGASEYYLNNGFNEYIAKPINFDLLIEKIFELTSKRMYSTE